MLEHAAACRHGDAVQALYQTDGRGRFNRVWSAEPGCALLLSVCLRPPVEEPHRLPQLAALAVAGLLGGHGIDAGVKWPNDVLARGRKIAGLLMERADDSSLVLGIGLNVNNTDDQFRQAGLLDTAASMATLTGRRFAIDGIRDDLLRALERLLSLPAPERADWIETEWPPRDSLRGRDVLIDTGHGSMRGQYRGIDAQGRLRLVDDHGVEQAFWSGDTTLAHAP
jgi:BirA family biotin operon repressor/biotin-[acetyl-CoA-carboxylase] ligase